MRPSRPLVGVVVSTIVLSFRPAIGAEKPKGADAWVAQARIEISAGRLDVARKYLETAIKRAPDHAEAHFVLCGVEIAEADRLVRGYGSQEKIDFEMDDAGKACGEAASLATEQERRATLLASVLRTQISRRRWGEAATSVQALRNGAPDDGRLVGAYAAMLDRAGRTQESVAALEGAAARGVEFDRAARFEYVWDRFDADDAQPVAPLIEKLRREETDPRRVAVLNVLAQALTDRGEKLMLAFLDIVEASVLTTVELEKLQASLVGSAARDPKKPPLRVDRESVDGLELPRLTTRTMPRYPEYARTQRQQGAVEMLARIEKDGRVGPLWVVRSSGPSFAAEAIAAVRNWRYTPARRDGEVIAFPFTIRVDFRFR